MHVPYDYRPQADLAEDIVDECALAVLVSNGQEHPEATHIPVFREGLLAPREGVIFGHMNRANSHGKNLADNLGVKLIFQGPGAYVTPILYQEDPAAPTWNYLSVHIVGRIRLLTAPEETLWVLTRTIEMFEARFGLGWDWRSSEHYFRRLLPGVRAFAIEIDRVDSMAKLSQEKSVQIRERVMSAFDEHTRYPVRELSRWMREYYQLEDRTTTSVAGALDNAGGQSQRQRGIIAGVTNPEGEQDA